MGEGGNTGEGGGMGEKEARGRGRHGGRGQQQQQQQQQAGRDAGGEFCSFALEEQRTSCILVKYSLSES